MGGHSIEDSDIKYGLSVTGTIHPSKILAKSGMRLNDRLILTKPLGMGIVNTAVKAGLVSEELQEKVIRLMAELNRRAAEIMSQFSISACTDVTGFGLLGHLAEMVGGTEMSVTIFSEQVPVIAEAFDFANMGFIPTAAYTNRQFRNSMVAFSDKIERSMQDVLFDPQTSGGLLICVDDNDADNLVAALRQGGVTDAAQIGEITSGPGEMINIIK